MLISCSLAMRLFKKQLDSKKDIIYLILFAVAGMLLLTLREYVLLVIPDFIPSIFIFTVYGVLICKKKIITALFWGILNYLMIGIVSIAIQLALSIVFNSSVEQLERQVDMRVMKRVMIRIFQLCVSELILHINRSIQHSDTHVTGRFRLIGIAVISIIILTVLWKVEFNITEYTLLYFNIFICISLLVLNLMSLFFFEIIAKEREEKEKLKIQNELSNLQIRNQNEIQELYNETRALKHDINTHLHTISGYIQLREFEKAEQYIKKITGLVNAAQLYYSEHSTINALIGSKSALARKNKIKLQIEVKVPPKMEMQRIRCWHCRK